MKKRYFSVNDIAVVSLFVAVISVCAYISVPFAIPFTLQLFGVLICAGLLSPKRATATVLCYVLLGAVGVPVFSNFQGGVHILLGQSGGFFIGFVFAPFLVAIASKTGKKGFLSLILSMLSAVLFCYICEVVWLLLVYKFNIRTAIISVAYFIIPDTIKAIFAAMLTLRLKKSARLLNE